MGRRPVMSNTQDDEMNFWITERDPIKEEAVTLRKFDHCFQKLVFDRGKLPN